MRGKLWTATARINMYFANLLLGMITWCTRYCQEGQVDTWHIGRFLERWASRAVIGKLEDCLTHYDRRDAVGMPGSLRSIYREPAESVATCLHYLFPEEVFDKMEELLEAMRLTEEL